MHGFLLMHWPVMKGAPFMQIASGDFPEMARWKWGEEAWGVKSWDQVSSYPKIKLVSPRKQLSHPYFKWNLPTYHHEIAFRTSRRAMKIGLLSPQSPCSRLFRMRWRRTWAEGTCIAEDFFPPKPSPLSGTSQTSFHLGGSTYCFSESWGASNVTMESRWEPADVSAKRQAWQLLMRTRFRAKNPDFENWGPHHPPVILANFAWICTETTLRSPRRTLGLHQCEVRGDDLCDANLLQLQNPDPKLFQKCEVCRKIKPCFVPKNLVPTPHNYIFDISIFPIIQFCREISPCNV